MVLLRMQADTMEERDHIKLMPLETVKVNNIASVFWTIFSSVAVGL